jgi:putative transposase
VEELNVQGLSRGMLASSVSNAGWNSFFAKLSYKAACAGRERVRVDPRGTSQTGVCGASVPKDVEGSLTRLSRVRIVWLAGCGRGK